MLLEPQLDQGFGEPSAEGGQAMDAGVTGGAQRHQPVGIMDPGVPVMDMEAAAREEAGLPCPATAAGAVAREHRFAVAVEAGAGARPGPVTGAAQTGDGGSTLAAGAEQGSLARARATASPVDGPGAEDRSCERGHHGSGPAAGGQKAAHAAVDNRVYHK